MNRYTASDMTELIRLLDTEKHPFAARQGERTFCFLTIQPDEQKNLKMVYYLDSHCGLELSDFIGRMAYGGFIIANEFYDIDYSIAHFFGIEYEKRRDMDALGKEIAVAINAKIRAMVLANPSLLEHDRIKREMTTDEWTRLNSRCDFEASKKAHDLFVSGQMPEFRYCAEFTREQTRMDGVYRYLATRQEFIDAEAKMILNEQMIKVYQCFAFYEAVKLHYELMEEDAGSAEHVERAIRTAIGEQKTVNVSALINGEEFAFKCKASMLKHGHCSTYHMDSKDRMAFEAKFGRHQGFGYSDILSIQYGRKTLYQR